MSRDITVETEIRDVSIIKDVLTQLGHTFQERAGMITVAGLRYSISINTDTGNVNYDEDIKSTVDKICQEYTTAVFKDRAIREGNQVTQEVNAQGEIVLHISRV